jgi:hypothetical protein
MDAHFLFPVSAHDDDDDGRLTSIRWEKNQFCTMIDGRTIDLSFFFLALSVAININDMPRSS